MTTPGSGLIDADRPLARRVARQAARPPVEAEVQELQRFVQRPSGGTKSGIFGFSVQSDATSGFKTFDGVGGGKPEFMLTVEEAA
jgi:hypothetical protein